MSSSPFTRRNAIGRGLLGAAAVWATRAARADEDERPAIGPDAQAALDRALAWLAKRQAEDGSFGAGAYAGSAAVSALAAMAMISAGSPPGRGPHGERVEGVVRYLLSRIQEDGSICHPPSAGSRPMYDHGFATLLLAEAFGMSEDERVGRALRDAVALILSTQNEEGGWRYQPVKKEADVSVTVCQLMALRAARNAGLHVPKETIDRATAYLESCQNDDGGFSYTPEEGGVSEFPRTAAALVGLQSAGKYEGPAIDKAVEYMLRRLPYPAEFNQQGHWFYGQYYAALALWTVGGAAWAKWYPAVRETLVAKQEPQGSWSDAIGREYATAMAILVLQSPASLLPIFER